MSDQGRDSARNDISTGACPGSNDQEVLEWLEALDGVLSSQGLNRCGELLQVLSRHAQSQGVPLHRILNTDLRNTITPATQPLYPGDLALEQRVTALLRWNAVAMVMRANSSGSEVGGHLASYASAADLFEVGFHHFFRADHADSSESESNADLVYFQPHSAPGIYARAYLEGRLTEQQLENFRRETGGVGLSSYPHPRLMPTFWQFPTGSMGLGVINAVYQARFLRYLQHRDLLKPSERRVWAFVGDGEMDEPESLAALTLAAREHLDNLIFVINCNLQRLDGPVRGNGSIVQELERVFMSAGWNVIKLLWGSEWDDLFARDPNDLIARQLNELVDGELQTYGANDGAYNRERFFSKTPELARLVGHLSDEELNALRRGGHDPVKIYAAFTAAVRHRGGPSVVLALTKKGYGLGRWGESRMSAHQQKKLPAEALLWFRDHIDLPLSDKDAMDLCFYRPPDDSPEIRYMRERRQALGGFLPTRRLKTEALSTPMLEAFGAFTLSEEAREISTTTAFVRMLSNLIRDDALGRFIVPIVADEARTFGMQSLFRYGIYSPTDQLYEPQDRGELLYYKESRTGQILEEGITEAGAISSWIAAGTSYSNHGVLLFPFYIFYSIFGFQRVGDLIWAAADSRARGFLIGATSGRTTLSGEGLQHQDGTSHLIASTIPSCRAFDPCYGYEVGAILEHGMKAIGEEQEDTFYYITTMNEMYAHPAMPNGAKVGIVRGMYQFRQSNSNRDALVQLLGSGAILREVIAAAELLEREWEIAATVWSVTSFTELRRDGMEKDRRRWLKGEQTSVPCWVEQCLDACPGPIVAATDYVRAVPDLIRPWIRRTYITLGTDGFGRSDTRPALRTFFEVDRTSIAYAAIAALVSEGILDKSLLLKFAKRYDYRAPSEAPWER